MSVPNQTPYIIYNANGLTTVFPFEFYIINAGDIQVTINGTVVSSGYSVSGVGNVGGGDVTFLTPPANGTVVMLERVVPTYRLTDYQDNGDLLADTVNKDFDRLWMAIQRSFIYLGLALRRPLFGGPYNAEGYRISNLENPVNDQDAVTKKYLEQVNTANLNRTLRVPEGYVNPLAPAEQRANRVQAYNSEGQPIFVLPGDGNASDVLIDLASTDPGKGASLSGYRRKPLKSVVSTVQGMLDAQYVNVWEFADLITIKPDADDPDTWDWTPAVQAALNAASIGITDPDPAHNGGCVYFPPTKKGVYKVTEIEVPIGVSIEGYGSTLSPVNQAEVHTHLIKFNGMSKVTGLLIAMDYSTTYSCAIWLRGRNNDFSQCSVWFSSNAVTVGDPAWLTDITKGWLGDSENTFTGCAFNWCLKTLTAYGLNTGVTFGGGSRVNCTRGNIPSGHPNAANWASAPATAITSYGALVMLSGCQSGSYIRDTPLFTSRVMPTNTSGYVNSYGRLYATNVWFEGSRIFYAPPESTVSADTITAGAILVNCFGDISPTLDGVATITASSQFQQTISLTGCTFYHDPTGTSRVASFINAPGARVGLSNNALSCIGGEVRNACNYSKPISSESLLLANAFGSAQTIGTSDTTLIMPNNGSIDLNDSSRGVWYSNSTGVFTAAVDCYNLEVQVNIRYSSPNSSNAITLNLVVGGTVVDSQVLSGGYPQKAFLNARLVTAGTNVTVHATASGTYVLDGTSSTKINIRARTGQGRQ